MSGVQVHVFDFDACLFRAPSPTAGLYTESGFKRIISELRWFDNPTIIERTAIAETNSENFIQTWFNPPIVSPTRYTPKRHQNINFLPRS
jgi:hypothetical protein